MSTNRVQTGLRIEEMIYAKAKAICTAEHRSLNNLVEYALQQYISSYEKEHGPIPVQPDDLYQ